MGGHAGMAEDTDFAALYRELGIDATCSLAELRGAWRRRVAKLHPDQGGDAEDTGRLQDLNRRFEAALDFHARFGRLPGAPLSGALAQPVTTAPCADAGAEGTAAFGRIPRYFVAAGLLGICVLGWRIVQTGDAGDGLTRGIHAADAHGGAGAEHPARAAIEVLAVSPGMDKARVRAILGEPLEMHDQRWSYGPSWVEFRCDRVIGWYSAPRRPLNVADGRESHADTTPAGTACD